MATSTTKNKAFSFSLETPSLSSGTLDKYLKSVLGEDSQTAIPEILKPRHPTNVTLTPSKEGDEPQQTSSPIMEEKHPLQQPQSSPSPPSQPPTLQGLNSSFTSATLLPAVASGIVHSPTLQQDLAIPAHAAHQIISAAENNELIPVPRGQNYVDITEYLNMPQADAAKKLGIPPSTLSKRWKEAVRKRKWPYRMICKIDKEIMTLLHNVPQGPNAPPLPEEIENALGISLRRRQEELRPVVIRI